MYAGPVLDSCIIFIGIVFDMMMMIKCLRYKREREREMPPIAYPSYKNHIFLFFLDGGDNNNNNNDIIILKLMVYNMVYKYENIM